ncbi:COQ9 family protein [Rhodophyticola sp. CCM32]|uniref:COQ9 family protein n=1 Tax=Rhodophyticola sp. CCM32 TaxID=2916397 RepID=UPI00107F49CB|nr:COQ9 family protein [Rhodophyticola sp. CCM32]QBY02258.1 COQ9 family protein [Rhodophyticola sp. CCM32]
MTDLSDNLIEAALDHVPFDGWSEGTFKAAINDTGVDEATARALFPRGAVDLALGFHRQGDAALGAALAAADLSQMRIRDRIAFALRTRLELVEDHKEAVRRGSTLFALPLYAADGARAIWNTCDAIWDGLGDASEDVNWYTKRATLSGVYGATLLYWLGDQSEGHIATWAFLDRRIENVMQFETFKKQINDNKLLQPFLVAPNWVLSRVKAPARMRDMDLPGRWRGHGKTET